MAWLSLIALVLGFVCLVTAVLDWSANGFSAEWGATGLMLGFIFMFLAWIALHD
jgi:hypothetical protein